MFSLTYPRSWLCSINALRGKRAGEVGLRPDGRLFESFGMELSRSNLVRLKAVYVDDDGF